MFYQLRTTFRKILGCFAEWEALSIVKHRSSLPDDRWKWNWAMALVLERTVLGKPRFSLWDSLLSNLILALLQIQLRGHLFTRLLPKTWSANQQGTTRINKQTNPNLTKVTLFIITLLPLTSMYTYEEAIKDVEIGGIVSTQSSDWLLCCWQQKLSK